MLVLLSSTWILKVNGFLVFYQGRIVWKLKMAFTLRILGLFLISKLRICLLLIILLILLGFKLIMGYPY